MHQMLESSRRMSRYIHYAISEKHENVWIAQREGRAKDSNDRTQDSVLKMMAMGGSGSFIENLKQLHIIPVSISYEYDPCDYLKAQEFQLKRDNPEYKKTPQDDLVNMHTGLFGNKGRVHFQMAPYLNDYLNIPSSNFHTMSNKPTENLPDNVSSHDENRVPIKSSDNLYTFDSE